MGLEEKVGKTAQKGGKKRVRWEGREGGTDRWRSGTPETCHSSHHHAACTRSVSLSLQVFYFLFFPIQHFLPSLFHFILSFILLSPHPSVTLRLPHNFTPSACLPSTPQQSALHFFPPSFAPHRPASPFGTHF